MIRVNSLAIGSVGYDEQSLRMKITFVKGKTYDFCGVPPYIYNGLLSASVVSHK